MMCQEQPNCLSVYLRETFGLLQLLQLLVLWKGPGKDLAGVCM